MPQFPQIDSAALAQAIKTFVTARQNVNALANGASANYDEVIRGWADALTSVMNPSLGYFENNDQTLFGLVNNTTTTSATPTLLFNTIGPIAVGQWVYQVSNDTVSLADSSSDSTGPVVGVVTAIPTATTARVQNVSSFIYTTSLPFLPLIPDTLYYAGPSGTIVSSSPNPPPGGYVQEVGFAKSATEIVLNIQERTLV